MIVQFACDKDQYGDVSHLSARTSSNSFGSPDMT